MDTAHTEGDMKMARMEKQDTAQHTQCRKVKGKDMGDLGRDLTRDTHMAETGDTNTAAEKEDTNPREPRKDSRQEKEEEKDSKEERIFKLRFTGIAMSAD